MVYKAKVGSQETPGVTDKFGSGVWNEAGQRLIEFCLREEGGEHMHSDLPFQLPLCVIYLILPITLRGG